MRSLVCISLLFLVQFSIANSETVQIQADKESGCLPLQINFSAVSESEQNWNWDFGNGAFSKQKSPLVIFTKAGVYTVKLTGNNGSSSSATITVYGSPDIDFTIERSKVCVNDAVRFTSALANPQQIKSYTWAFGDGKTIENNNLSAPVHYYSKDGQYDVSLMVTDINGCTADKTIYGGVQANAKPEVDFQPSTGSSCSESEKISFTNLSNGGAKLNYYWNFGDKNTSEETNPTHIFSQGKYDVTLTVKNENGCIAAVTKKVSVIKLKADFISEKEDACAGENLRFVNTSNYKGGKWSWEFSDGTASAESNPIKAFAKSGIYSVKFTITDEACSQTVSKENYITIREGIKTAFTSDVSSNCNSPVAVKLKNKTSNSAVVLWNFGDGTTSTKNEVEKVYTEPGNYKVSLEVTDSMGCSYKAESEKTIHALKPIVNFRADTFACAGYQVKFTNFTPNAESFLWNFGDGQISTLKNPQHIYEKDGHYSVSLTAYGDGCDSTVILKNYVRVGALEVDFEVASASQSLVPPFLFRFKNKTNIANVKYLWDFGDGTTDASPDPVHVYNTPGNFNVRLVAYAKNGCSNSKVIPHNIQMGTSMEDMIGKE